MQKEFKRFYNYLFVKDIERLCKIFGIKYEDFLIANSHKSFAVGEHESYNTKDVVNYILQNC